MAPASPESLFLFANVFIKGKRVVSKENSRKMCVKCGRSAACSKKEQWRRRQKKHYTTPLTKTIVRLCLCLNLTDNSTSQHTSPCKKGATRKRFTLRGVRQATTASQNNITSPGVIQPTPLCTYSGCTAAGPRAQTALYKPTDDKGSVGRQRRWPRICFDSIRNHHGIKKKQIIKSRGEDTK